MIILHCIKKGGKNKMKKAIGYIRVSTVKQEVEGVSLDEQADKIKDYCKFKDIELIDIIADKGVSAGKPLNSREGGHRLNKRIDNKEAEIVVAVKLDRLFRDAADCLNTSKKWDDQGIALHLLDLGGSTLDTSSAMGRMFLTMSAGFAEMERNLTSERTKAALKYKKSKKEAYGHTPVGYKREGEDLIKDDEEMEAVEIIKEGKEEGLSLRDIANKLNELGFKTKQGGKKWYASTVNYILKNDLYKEATV